MLKILFLILKGIYLLIPKFIRNQYSDSIYFYREMIRLLKQKVFNKVKEKTNNTSKVLKLFLVDSVEKLNCEYELLFQKSNRISFINHPKIRIDNQNFFKSELNNIVPDINIYRIKNVSIIGHTDALLFEESFFHTELNFMEYFHDMKRPEIFMKNNDSTYDVKVDSYDKNINDKKYITLLKEHSINYFHWLTECVPRFILTLNILRKEDINFNVNDYTILIDEGLPKQCIDILELVSEEKLKFYYLKKGQKFLCEELIYCSPFWHSLDNTTGLPNPKKEFFIDRYALEIVRETILKKFNLSNSISGYNHKKVYLQRVNNKLRPITNLNQLELLLFKNGYEFIDIGSLTLKEQIELFQNVDVVIGASGASFANLLFMREGSQAINFYPSVSATNYYVFQPLADVSNVDLTHYLTIPKENEFSVHSESSIDLKNLESFLKEL